MKALNVISCTLLVFALISIIGSVNANSISGLNVTDPIPGFGGKLSVSLNETTLHVGDTVTLTIHPQNYGESDWENVLIYAPIPEGFKYVSYVVPDRTMQDYNPATGIWNVQQMLHDGRGSDKELILTLEVLPSAVGTHVIFPAYCVKFTSLISVYPNGVNSNPDYYDVVGSNQSPSNSRAITVTVLPVSNDSGQGNNTGNGTGHGTGNGTAIGPISGNGSGSHTVSTNPKVSSTNPKKGSLGVSKTKVIAVKFNKNVKTSVKWSKIYIKNLRTGQKVSIKKWISGNTLYIKMTKTRYAYNWYQVYIPDHAVKNSAGSNLAAAYTFKFKTGKY